MSATRTFKAIFSKYKTGEKHIEIVRAEDRHAALSIVSEIFEDRFEPNGYLFAEFDEVFGVRHDRSWCLPQRD